MQRALGAGLSIRTLSPADWQIFSAMRIKAVDMHTGLFQTHPDDARAEPPEVWKETLDGQGKQVFGVFDGENLIGITAVFTWREDPSGQSGVMAMSFLEPAYRGRGLAAELYKARIDFALSHKLWGRLVCAHRQGNEPSRRAMIARGFKHIETKEIDWPDGTRDIEHIYALDLETLRARVS